MTPQPMSDETSERRFPAVSRRAFLRRSAVVGLAAAAAPALAACGGSSSAAPSSTASPATGGASTDAPAPVTTDGAATSTDPAASPTDATAATDPPATTTGPAFPAGSQVQIDFTYQAGGGGRIHSPYIAVWIEDQAGDLVQTVSLWYKSDESKYLRDLKRWNSKNNGSALTTGATRIPGSFSVEWNGTNLDGATVDAGDYFVCIEAAREKGPYQIIRETVPIRGTLSPTTLTPSGELTAASVEMIA